MSFEDKNSEECSESFVNKNNEKSEENSKSNNRTHHTRFFEKLYGNLEKSSENKTQSILEKSFKSKSRESVHSPCESSVGSINDLSISRWIN